EPARVQIPIAEEFPRAAVKSVGTRLGSHHNLATDAVTILAVELLRLDLDFHNSLRWRKVHSGGLGPICPIGAVEHKIVVYLARAVDRQHGPAARVGPGFGGADVGNAGQTLRYGR